MFQGREAYEIQVKLDSPEISALSDFDNFMIITSSGDAIPLSSLATVTERREYARIGHINRSRVINVYGDIDAAEANTSEVLVDMQAKFLIPMAVSLGFGILFATAITLILVPSVYLMLEDVKRFGSWMLFKKK